MSQDQKPASPAYITEQHRRANGSWPESDGEIDYELHRLTGCPCARAAESETKESGT